MNDAHSNPTRLLMYGQEQTLLDTRRFILQMAGFVLEMTSSLDAVKAQLDGGASYRLLFVCHTASPADRRSLAALAEKVALPLYQIETLITPEELIAQAAARR